MEVICTRPTCPRPQNSFAELDDLSQLKTIQQRYCKTCGMPLILAGRYIPSKLLGKGGFGAAFLAVDRYTPTIRKCVVKQFQPSGQLDSEDLDTAQKLFEREAEALENLGKEHQQIPNLYAFFPLIVQNIDNSKEEQFFYIVQELIDGLTLEQELESQGKFSAAQIQMVLEEMLKILNFVHEKGTIHRDIKPSNIMKDKQGRLYLLDFGAVRQIASGAGTKIQGKSTGIYSLGFAPPEQMAGAEVYPCTDLYALAASCINLATGKTPDQLYDVYNNELNWKPEAKQLSDRLINILDIMLKPAPRDRFQSASEVLNALTYPTSITGTSQPGVIAQPPPTVIPPTPLQPPRGSITWATFSPLELISSAAFTGFETALLLIVLRNFFSVPVSLGILAVILVGLVFAQYRRGIEKWDLLIFAVISALLMWFLPVLRGSYSRELALFFAAMVGIGAVFATTVFRIVYVLLSRRN